MRPDLLLALLIAAITLCLPARWAEAQAAPSPAPPRAAPAPRAEPPQASREPAQARKSVSEKLFDTDWVLFPARLALIIVFLATAAFLLMGGSWVTVRIAHSLKHLQWKHPPRRLKRGEVGAAGTTLAVEWEEHLRTDLKNDEERDRQIAWLREVVDRLARDHRQIAAALANRDTAEGSRPDGETEALG